MVTRDAAPDPSRTAEPERVSVPVAVRPALEEVPIEMTPAVWVMSPPTARSNDRVRAEHREDDLTGTVHEPVGEINGVLGHIESVAARVAPDREGDRRGRDGG